MLTNNNEKKLVFYLYESPMNKDENISMEIKIQWKKIIYSKANSNEERMSLKGHHWRRKKYSLNDNKLQWTLIFLSIKTNTNEQKLLFQW